MSPVLVLTSLPNASAAEALARHLVECRLAACVNVLGPCRSIYRWREAVETADEVPLLIKTSRERYAALEAAIRERHPYEVPEVIALPIVDGLAAYLAWLGEETDGPGGPP